MNHTKIPQNFIYPEITPKHYRFGSNQIEADDLREDGDWRGYLPEPEDQNKWGVESSSCYVFNQLSAIATLIEEQYQILNSDFSARFNALLSNGTPYGGDPLKGAESITNDGVIKEELLPFLENIKKWSEYHSFVGSDEEACRKAGQEFLEDWELKYDIVFDRNDSIEDKYIKLRKALKKSPVPIAVYAWVENGGVYIKPKGTEDNHLTLCVYLDEQNRPYYWDSYSPYLKVGEPFYDSSFAMRWSVKKKAKEPSWWDILLANLKKYYERLFKKLI